MELTQNTLLASGVHAWLGMNVVYLATLTHSLVEDPT